MKKIGSTLLGLWTIPSSTTYPAKKFARTFDTVNCMCRYMHNKNTQEIKLKEPSSQFAQILTNFERTKTNQLVVILPWLEAKKKHVEQYAQFYLNHSCDVLVVTLSWYNVLSAKAGTKAIAKDVVTFLDESERYQRIFVHGFSSGVYLWGEVLDFMLQNQNKYDSVKEKILGQAWDSMIIMDIEMLQRKFPEMNFPQSLLLQRQFQKVLQIHLSDFPSFSNHDYIPSFKRVRENDLVKSPTLVLGSRDDQIWCLNSVEDTVSCWRKQGLEVDVKLWERSPHVGHLQHHKEEYEETLKNHLKKLKFPNFILDNESSSSKKDTE